MHEGSWAQEGYKIKQDAKLEGWFPLPSGMGGQFEVQNRLKINLGAINKMINCWIVSGIGTKTMSNNHQKSGDARVRRWSAGGPGVVCKGISSWP